MNLLDDASGIKHALQLSSMTEFVAYVNARAFLFGRVTLCGINADLFRWLLFWVKYLDVLLARHSAAHGIHIDLLGRKGSQA